MWHECAVAITGVFDATLKTKPYLFALLPWQWTISACHSRNPLPTLRISPGIVAKPEDFCTTDLGHSCISIQLLALVTIKISWPAASCVSTSVLLLEATPSCERVDIKCAIFMFTISPERWWFVSKNLITNLHWRIWIFLLLFVHE